MYLYSQIAGLHDNLAKIKEVYIKMRHLATFNLVNHEKYFFSQILPLYNFQIYNFHIYDYF